jgi:hypothetical protein
MLGRKITDWKEEPMLDQTVKGEGVTVVEKIVLSFDICSSSDIIEDLTLT